MQFICADGSAIERIPIIFTKRVEVPFLQDPNLGRNFFVASSAHGYMTRALWVELIREVGSPLLLSNTCSSSCLMWRHFGLPRGNLMQPFSF